VRDPKRPYVILMELPATEESGWKEMAGSSAELRERTLFDGPARFFSRQGSIRMTFVRHPRWTMNLDLPKSP
jgi:hypothetical protein